MWDRPALQGAIFSSYTPLFLSFPFTKCALLSHPNRNPLSHRHCRQVVGLAIGFSKTIEVDMAMCLQGNEESELPEVVFGGCKCRRVDMSDPACRQKL